MNVISPDHLSIHIHTSSAECRDCRPGIRRSHEIDTEITISQHNHSRSHLIIHIHNSSAECRDCRPGIQRSHEIGLEIAISRHDHSRSHVITDIHTLSAGCRDCRPGIRRSHEIEVEIATSHLLAPSHTFSPLLTPSTLPLSDGGRYPRGSRADLHPRCTSWTWPRKPLAVRWPARDEV